MAATRNGVSSEAGQAARVILGVRVDAVTYGHVQTQVIDWAHRRQSRYVCVANVHMVMEAYDNRSFRDIVNGAAIVTPDGMPLVWSLRLLGILHPQRVYGPTLTLAICEKAAQERIPVAFIGGTPAALKGLVASLKERFRDLQIVYHWSPPFRELTLDEESQMLHALRDCAARIVFVGLGCPKQERWMARLHRHIAGPLIGVGAAFDFLSGQKRQAPPTMQNLGLEWLFRLATEPRRLWRRYAYQNPRFILHFSRQFAQSRTGLLSPRSNSRETAED
jgi:N-acetylglucosaminyldiphosphoundecaprenol N-acetyl-beta-D-mannosaminyltransferase